MPSRSAWLAAAVISAACGASPAIAGSQSSNSSSNCSNGHCMRVESFETERGGFRRGWTRIEHWDGRQYRGERPWRGYERPYRHQGPRRPRRGNNLDD